MQINTTYTTVHLYKTGENELKILKQNIYKYKAKSVISNASVTCTILLLLVLAERGGVHSSQVPL